MNPYIRSQSECDIANHACECLWGQRCQAVPAETLATLWGRIEQMTQELTAELERAMSATPSGSTLAQTMTAIKLAKVLELQVRELKAEVRS